MFSSFKCVKVFNLWEKKIFILALKIIRISLKWYSKEHLYAKFSISTTISSAEHFWQIFRTKMTPQSTAETPALGLSTLAAHYSFQEGVVKILMSSPPSHRDSNFICLRCCPGIVVSLNVPRWFSCAVRIGNFTSNVIREQKKMREPRLRNGKDLLVFPYTVVHITWILDSKHCYQSLGCISILRHSGLTL